MLILTMIVKNESKIIKRCIESALPHVRGVVVCDTGSTDDTVEVVRSLTREVDCDLRVAEHKWVSFGHNRTLSVETSRELFGSRPDVWFLLMDADMRLVVKDREKFNMLFLDSGKSGYLMQQRNGSLHYNNVRLIRSSDPWKCSYPTHEVWGSPGNVGTVDPSIAYIDDVGDGGCKSDKFERDYKLLKEYLDGNPDDHRTLFYLGESCKNSGRYEEAIQYYTRRHDVGGWDQERWYSLYQMGHIYSIEDYEKHDWKKSIEYWTRAFKLLPERLEAPYNISRTFRERDESLLAYVWAKYCYDRRHNIKEGLFVESDVYNSHISYEMSISAYYGRDMRAGADSCDETSSSRVAGWHKNSNSIANRRWYPNYIFPTEKIKTYTCESLGLDSWYPTNPSFIEQDGKVHLNMRLVNYRVENQTDKYTYSTNECKTMNFLVRDWFSEKKIEVPDLNLQNMLNAPYQAPNVQGYEDLRLFLLNNDLFSISTVHEGNRKNRMHILNATQENVMGWCSSEASRITIDISANFDFQDCEKNWVPLQHSSSDEGVIKLMYGWDPLVSLDLKVDSTSKKGRVMKVHKNPQLEFLVDGSPFTFTHARGSCGGLRWGSDEEFLFLVHFVGMEGKKRWYYQRFVTLKICPHPVVTKVSSLVKFSEEPIEFPGMCECPWDDKKLLLALGVNDNKIEIRTMFKQDINERLKEVLSI